MKKALLVDTNFAAGPIRFALQNSGYQVFTVGARERDPLAGASENYFKVDYSDADALEALTCDLGVDVLVPGCNDLSYLMCSNVAQRLTLPGLEPPEVVATLHSKKLFRDLCSSLSIPAPRRYDTVSDALRSGGSVIVKPTDGYSGRGVEIVICPSADELEQATLRSRQYSQTGTALLEEFVEGELFSYSAFISQGRVVCAFHVAEFGSVNPFVVDTSFVIPAPEFTPDLQHFTERLVKELGIDGGLMHLQYIANEDQFWIIEPTRRCPGDLYSRLIQLSTDYPYAEAYVSRFLSRQIPVPDQLAEHNIVRHTVTAKEAGVLESMTVHINAALTEWIPLSTVGEALAPSPKGRVGVAFFTAADVVARDALVQNLLAGNVFELSYSRLQ